MKSGKVVIAEYGPRESPLGYIECQEQGWIMWWYEDGTATLYTKRGPTGAVQGKPIECGKKVRKPRELAEIRSK